jgi:hypothetical protein
MLMLLGWGRRAKLSLLFEEKAVALLGELSRVYAALWVEYLFF